MLSFAPLRGIRSARATQHFCPRRSEWAYAKLSRVRCSSVARAFVSANQADHCFPAVQLLCQPTMPSAEANACTCSIR